MISAWTTYLDPALLVKFTSIGFSAEDAEVAVHIIEDALREDSPAGDALRKRLGFTFHTGIDIGEVSALGTDHEAPVKHIRKWTYTTPWREVLP